MCLSCCLTSSPGRVDSWTKCHHMIQPIQGPPIWLRGKFVGSPLQLPDRTILLPRFRLRKMPRHNVSHLPAPTTTISYDSFMTLVVAIPRGVIVWLGIMIGGFLICNLLWNTDRLGEATDRKQTEKDIFNFREYGKTTRNIS